MITTPRLLIRPWQPRDHQPFIDMNQDPLVMRYFPSVLTPAESIDAIRNYEQRFEQDGFGFWATELLATGQFIGVLGLSRIRFDAPFTPGIEIGWRLAQPFWNQGLATEGAAAILAHAFHQLALDEVVAITAATNIPSRRIMEKLHMTYNPADDFLHPRLASDHPLAPHVLYRARREILKPT